MSHQTIYEDLPNITSLPESVSGVMHLEKQGGLMTSQSGQEAAHANLSARQAKEKGLLTRGTFGLHSSTSSVSASLSISLANKLQVVTQILGSTLYKLTWKQWDTPLGLCRLRQRASALRISESAHIGWPTPQVSDANMRQTRGSKSSIRQAKRSQLASVALEYCDLDLIRAEQIDGLNGCHAEMGSGDLLNPAHSRWLMCLPKEWDEQSPYWKEWQDVIEREG